MRTHDPDGYVESGVVYFQLKSSDNFVASGGQIPFDMDIRDYNLWRDEVMPVILILFHAIARKAYWLPIQHYFRENPTCRPRTGAKTIRVHVSQRLSVNRRTVRQIRTVKEETVVRLGREV